MLLVGENATQAAEALKKRRKSPGPLLPRKEEIMKNIQPKPMWPLEAVARRREAAEVSPRQKSASGGG